MIYPGLEEHPGHAVASRQMKRYGGIVSFRVTGGEEHALDVCDRTRVFTLGESLGGVESLIEHPGRMTHASVAGPFDAFLTHRGLKTLGVRMDRHCDNAEKVVDFLAGHPAVAQVIYPGLEEHPGHAVAARQMKRFGGIVSFRVKAGEQAALDVCAKAEVFTLGESLGGVESLIEHPGRMTHASVAGTDLEVPSDLIRLSVGIEDAEDLVADLGQALDRLT